MPAALFSIRYLNHHRAFDKGHGRNYYVLSLRFDFKHSNSFIKVRIQLGMHKSVRELLGFASIIAESGSDFLYLIFWDSKLCATIAKTLCQFHVVGWWSLCCTSYFVATKYFSSFDRHSVLLIWILSNPIYTQIMLIRPSGGFKTRWGITSWCDKKNGQIKTGVDSLCGSPTVNFGIFLVFGCRSFFTIDIQFLTLKRLLWRGRRWRRLDWWRRYVLESSSCFGKVLWRFYRQLHYKQVPGVSRKSSHSENTREGGKCPNRSATFSS